MLSSFHSLCESTTTFVFLAYLFILPSVISCSRPICLKMWLQWCFHCHIAFNICSSSFTFLSTSSLVTLSIQLIPSCLEKKTSTATKMEVDLSYWKWSETCRHWSAHRVASSTRLSWLEELHGDSNAPLGAMGMQLKVDDDSFSCNCLYLMCTVVCVDHVCLLWASWVD